MIKGYNYSREQLELIIHNKFSKIPLDHLLKNAWAFVSLQSTAGFKAMIQGVPAYFTDSSLKNISNISHFLKELNIEDKLRPEQISVDKFCELANLIYSFKK